MALAQPPRCLRRRASKDVQDDENMLHDSDDLEAGRAERPMVLVQIPMFNEKQVRLDVTHSLHDILICVFGHNEKQVRRFVGCHSCVLKFFWLFCCPWLPTHDLQMMWRQFI
jgi:hypothetical protein